MLIRVQNKVIIRIFWGKREDGYPSYVKASHELWIQWFIETRKENLLTFYKFLLQYRNRKEDYEH